MTDSELLHALFEGSDLAYGSTEVTGKVNASGKREARCVVIRKPPGTIQWDAHLMGAVGLGIFPIRSDNSVRFGAIDVDIYQGLDLAKMNTRIQEHKIPMILCRSKSGGPHLFMFFKEPVPAKIVVEKLDAIAGFMGFGKSEIFPKQTTISGNDVGNFINMPYYGGVNFMRYAFDAEGKAISTIAGFSAYCDSRAMTKAETEAYTAPIESGALPDGPPCLNRIIATGRGEMRNIVLSNIAVYCKKAFPDTWETELDRYNQKFPEPLGSKEVEAIKKSYQKKDYRYQCSVDPLKSFCNSTACRKCKFGVGRQDLMPAQRSLTKINTSPPVWYLDVIHTGKDGKDEPKRMCLTTEELQNPRLFQRKCMDTIQEMPPLLKPEDWQPKIALLMEHCNVIDLPEELSPAGQFKELVQEFIFNRASAEGWEDLLRGLPHRNNLGYHFRPKDLWKFITNQRFVLLKQNEMLAILRNDLKSERGFRPIKGTGVNYMTVKFPEPIPEKLEVPVSESQF